MVRAGHRPYPGRVLTPSTAVVIDREGLSAILRALVDDGRTLHGPTTDGDAIVIDTLRDVDDLPAGVGDEQAPARYRLRRREDDALFGYAVPAQGWKRVLYPPRTELVRIRRKDDALTVETPPSPAARKAFIGVRPCELAAIAVQDRVLTGGAHADADYRARRADVFVLAVHCGAPAETCFCASMGTGPRAEAGFDLAATELIDARGHRFVVEVGSEHGRAILARAPAHPPTDDDLEAARAVTDRAAAAQTRALPPDTRTALASVLDHPHWHDVAARCLGCASCTMACPTCFCTTVEDTTDLTGELATRTRRWDSCLTGEYAYVHGGSSRPSLRARYRQWLTHKLMNWHEQFGTSGCTGCGRCITWCPAGIDLTREVAALTAPAPAPASRS